MSRWRSRPSGRIAYNSARATSDLKADWTQQWIDIYSMAADGCDVRRHATCVCRPDRLVTAAIAVKNHGPAVWGQVRIGIAHGSKRYRLSRGDGEQDAEHGRYGKLIAVALNHFAANRR